MTAESRADAVTILSVALALLIGVPAILVFAPLGASGSPGTLIGLLALFWWATARFVPSLNLDSGVQPIRIAILLLTMAILLSYSAAFTRVIAPVEARAADRGLISLAGWAGLALLTADGVRSYARLEVLIKRIVAGAGVLAGVGILQFAFGLDIAGMIRFPGLSANGAVDYISGRSVFRRVAGTASHPIEFGVVLTLALPLAIHLATSCRHGRRGVQWLAVALIAIAIPLSVSRSAILGLFIGMIVLFTGWSWRRRGYLLAITPVFLVGVKVLAPGLLGTLSGLFAALAYDPSIQGRLSDYGMVDMFLSSAPALGRGFRTFVPTEYFFLDNQYLGAIVELGLIGLGAILVLFGAALLSARGARRRVRDPVVRDLAQALAASVMIAAVTFGTFDTLSFPMASGLIFLIIGCCGALWRLSGGQQGPKAVTVDAAGAR